MATDELRDRFRGSLLWGAVGDALGRPVETWNVHWVRERYGPEGLQHYEPWAGWKSGPIGTITDDTQLTMEVARSLLATGGRFDPNDFVPRLIAWLPIGRGKGRATTNAVRALARGVHWSQMRDHEDSGGNGGAMRAAPIGLVHAFDASPERLVDDAILSARPTHAHPVGIAGAVAIAAGVAWCAAHVTEPFGNPRVFLDFVDACLDGIEPEPTLERKPNPRYVRLRERVAELSDLLTWPEPAKVFAYTYNGAFALESVPAALYCFLRAPDDPRQVILTAVNAGRDADSVASMAGNLVGARCGAERLRVECPEWWNELEYRDELIQLADGLLELARQGAM